VTENASLTASNLWPCGGPNDCALYWTVRDLVILSCSPVSLIRSGTEEFEMDDVRLRPVTFEQLSAVRHSVFVSESADRDPPEFLVIRYEGVYRDGSSGRGDALYLVAAAEAAQKAWWAPCTILDLREFQYSCGDEMEWITSIGWDRVTRCHSPLAIVVSDKCRAALKSLLEAEFDRFCVESMEAAYSSCRKQEIEWERAMKVWREKH